MEDDVGAEFEGLLEVGRGESVVDPDQDPALLRDRRDFLDVHEVHERVRRGLEPEEPGVRADGALEILRVAPVNIGEIQPEEPSDPLELAHRAAVEIVDRHHVVAGFE